LLSDLLRIPDQQRAVRPSLGIEPGAGRGRPATLLADVGESTGVAGEELVGGFLRGLRDVPERMDPDLQSIRRVSVLVTRFSIQIDQGPEAPRFAADDRDHQWQSESPGTGEGLRSSADPQPDRQRILYRPGIDALPRQRRAEPA